MRPAVLAVGYAGYIILSLSLIPTPMAVVRHCDSQRANTRRRLLDDGHYRRKKYSLSTTWLVICNVMYQTRHTNEIYNRSALLLVVRHTLMYSTTNHDSARCTMVRR